MSCNTIRKYHFFTPATVIRVEKWLSMMSEKGWRLTSQKGFKFTFISCAPVHREYFIYTGFDSSRGISFDYFMAREKYAIRGNSIKSNSIFEVNTHLKDEVFEQYVALRNSYYRRHYIGLLLICLLGTVGCLLLRVQEDTGLALWMVSGLLLYSFLSTCVILLDSRSQKRK